MSIVGRRKGRVGSFLLMLRLLSQQKEQDQELKTEEPKPDEPEPTRLPSYRRRAARQASS